MKYVKINLLTLILSTCLSFTAMADSQTEGKQVFDQWCQGCHMDSPFAPGTIYLKATRGEAQAIIENRENLSAELVKNMVRKGYGGMPSFRKTEISDSELTALLNYLSQKNRWGIL